MRSMASSSDYWRRRALADEEKAQQVAGRMLREQRKVYRQAYADIERALDALYTQAVDQGAESLTRTQLWKYSKYKQLKAVMQEQTGEIAKGQITAIESTLERIFKDTIGAASKAFSGQDIRFNGVSDARVKRLVKSNWSGESFSKRVWRNTREIARRVEKDVTDMMVLGKSPSAVKQQLMHDYNVGFRAADRLVRTEASHAYNSAALESYKAAGVTQVEVLIGKDDRLCDECAGIAGVYDIDKAPRLPVHPHCRCTYAPVVDLEAEIKAVEAAKTVQNTAQNGIINIKTDEFTPCLRDTKTGELVQTDVRRFDDHKALKSYSQKTGWNVNWADVPDDVEVYGVSVQGSDEIQGLIGIRNDKEQQAVYLHWASTAPQNNKLITGGMQAYTGVGGHLFAIGAEKSIDFGYGGYMYGYAANAAVEKHYIRSLGAHHIGMLHPYQFEIDERAAAELLKKYNYTWR